jgi:phosphoserine phosphatase
MDGNALTLISAAPGAETEGWVGEAARALDRLGAHLGGTDWLAPSLAAEIRFDRLDPDQAEAAVRTALGLGFDGPPLDVIVQPTENRKKRLLVADMESTVIANEMLNEIAEIAGIGPRIADITRHTMNDEIDFASALRERVALLQGKPAGLLAAAAKRIRINPGAQALVATMRWSGARTALVSGGFRVFAAPVARMLGFDCDVANRLQIGDNVIAGIAEPILGRQSKLETLTRLAAENGLSLAETLAVGDGANDLDMIGAAGLGVAFHSHPNVAPRARHRIDHADLTALLYAQGYRRDEIVEA